MNADDLKATIADEMAKRDFAAEMAANVERQVDNIRSKSTSRVEGLARGLVYGVLGGLLGLVALIVILIGLFRVAVLIPPNPGSWTTWLVFGLVFSIGGLVAWRMRPKIGPTPPSS